MSVTPDVSQIEMGPYLTSALAESLHQCRTAVRRLVLSVIFTRVVGIFVGARDVVGAGDIVGDGTVIVKTLFSRARAEAGHRESEDAETSRATSVEIRRYLRLLSGYFTEKCAISTLEYLVRRFKIHVYDVDDFIACALPWHSTAEFVKCAQTCQLEDSKHFKWLSGVKETGAAPPRDALAVRCSKDKAFFSFCAERATEMATAKVRGSSVSRFRLIRFLF